MSTRTNIRDASHLLLRIDRHSIRQFKLSIEGSRILGSHALRHNLVQKLEHFAVSHQRREVVVVKLSVWRGQRGLEEGGGRVR